MTNLLKRIGALLLALALVLCMALFTYDRRLKISNINGCASNAKQSTEIYASSQKPDLLSSRFFPNP